MVVWQVSVIAACILYVLVLGSRHGQSSAWISPAVGAAFGLTVALGVADTFADGMLDGVGLGVVAGQSGSSSPLSRVTIWSASARSRAVMP